MQRNREDRANACARALNVIDTTKKRLLLSCTSPRDRYFASGDFITRATEQRMNYDEYIHEESRFIVNNRQ